MIFEIPFKESVFREQMTLNFKLVWKENLSKNKLSFIASSISILLGIVVIYIGNMTGFIFIALGLHYLVNFLTYYSFYKKSKKKYTQFVELEITRHIQAGEKCIWEFNDIYFRYKDYKYEVKIKWDAFKGTRVIQKHLFLDLEVGDNASYIIGENEIGAENLKKVTDFATKHISLFATTH